MANLQNYLGPGTCVNHVSNNPDAFRDAFWQINGLRVYQAARA